MTSIEIGGFLLKMTLGTDVGWISVEISLLPFTCGKVLPNLPNMILMLDTH
jgi:hypothetical protein